MIFYLSLKGNMWEEKKYEGYGVFGGKDYYELMAEMNGYTDKDGKGDLRQIGIDIEFKKKKSKTSKKPLFPALVSNKNFNWKKHDFTQSPESDPNQGWETQDNGDDWDEGPFAGRW